MGVEQQGSELPAPDQLGDDDSDESCPGSRSPAGRQSRAWFGRGASPTGSMTWRGWLRIEAVPGVEQVLIANLPDVQHGQLGGLDHLGVFDGALCRSTGVRGEHDRPVRRRDRRLTDQSQDGRRPRCSDCGSRACPRQATESPRSRSRLRAVNLTNEITTRTTAVVVAPMALMTIDRCHPGSRVPKPSAHHAELGKSEAEEDPDHVELDQPAHLGVEDPDRAGWRRLRGRRSRWRTPVDHPRLRN